MNDKEKEYFENFKKDEISEAELEKGEKKAKNLGKVSGDFLTLINMLRDSNFKIPAWAVATIIGAIIYVVSPIDAVPDVLPVVGWADDAGVVTAVVGALAAIIKEYKDFKGEN